MDSVVFLMFCCLCLYIGYLADKRYKSTEIIDELVSENVDLKSENEKLKKDRC